MNRLEALGRDHHHHREAPNAIRQLGGDYPDGRDGQELVNGKLDKALVLTPGRIESEEAGAYNR